MHEFSKNSVFTVVPKICMLQLMELGNIGIPMPSAECMGLYRGGLLSKSIPRISSISVDPFLEHYELSFEMGRMFVRSMC